MLIQQYDLGITVLGPVTSQEQVTDLSFLLSSSWPQQIARLRSELDIARGNTKVMSEMLTEMVPGQEDSSDLELLQVRDLTLWEPQAPGGSRAGGTKPR